MRSKKQRVVIALKTAVTMFKKHDTIMVSCNDYFTNMLMEAIELLQERPVRVTVTNKYWGKCEGCGEMFRIFTMAAVKAKHCPNCGKEIDWNGTADQ